VDDRDGGWTADGRHAPRRNRIAEVYDHIRWCWVALALASLVLQATYSATMSATHADILTKGQFGLTLAFAAEIVLRGAACLPHWRGFFWKGQNVLDLVLALGSSVIQIPAVRRSGWGPWLTIFELARFYRVILEIPRMRPLLVRPAPAAAPARPLTLTAPQLSVFGNMYGLANMTLFLLIMNYISALIATQMFRGDLPRGEPMNFGQIFTSFLAVYQVFSSENWTNLLYSTASAEALFGQIPFLTLFLVAWFFIANCACILYYSRSRVQHRLS
jgi:hypothetical protein